ncbi:MAG: hypothetical protein K5768_04645 [Firmicutes bacterium]|nr:hypothetical protein [Bacillota bacterium]
MREKMCCFDGDGIKYDTEKLKRILIQIIEKEGVKKFCFLRKSALDKTAISILKELKGIYPDILFGLVMPNIDRNKFDFTGKPYDEYDFFLTDTIAQKTADGWEIKSWNHYMVDCSTHLVCSSSKAKSRAANTLEYAKSRENIKIFNIDEI